MDLYSHNNYFLSLIAGDKISIIDNNSDNKKLNEFANKYNYHLLFFKNNNNPEEFGEKNYKKRNIYLLDDKKILKNNKQYDFKYIVFVIFHLEFILDLNEKIDHRKYKEYLKKFCDETDTKIYFYRENTNLFEIIGTSNKNIIELTYDLESDGSINSYKTKKTTKFNKDEQRIIKHPIIKKYDTIKQDYLNLKNYITSSIIKTEPNKLEKAIEDKENFYKQEKQNDVMNKEKQKQDKINLRIVKERKAKIAKAIKNIKESQMKKQIFDIIEVKPFYKIDNIRNDDKGIMNSSGYFCYFNTAIQLLRNIPDLEEKIINLSDDDIKQLSENSDSETIKYKNAIKILRNIFRKIQTGIIENKEVWLYDEMTDISHMFVKYLNGVGKQNDSEVIINIFLTTLEFFDNKFKYKDLITIKSKKTQECTSNDPKQKINIDIQKYLYFHHTKNETVYLNKKLNEKQEELLFHNDCSDTNCSNCSNYKAQYKHKDKKEYLCNYHYKGKEKSLYTSIENMKQITEYSFDTCEILFVVLLRHENDYSVKNESIVLNYEILTMNDYIYELKGCIIHEGTPIKGHYYYINYETKKIINENNISNFSINNTIVETNSYFYLYVLKEINIEYIIRNFDTLCIDFITILLNLSEDEIKHKKYTAIIIDLHNEYKFLLTNYENKFDELIDKGIVRKANTQEPKIIFKIFLDLITFINDKINIPNIKIIINKDTILVDFTKHIENLLEVILSLPTKNLTYLFTYLFIKIFLKISQAEYILIAELSPQTQPQSQQSQQPQTQPLPQIQPPPQPQPPPQTQTQPQPPPQTQTQTQPQSQPQQPKPPSTLPPQPKPPSQPKPPLLKLQ